MTNNLIGYRVCLKRLGRLGNVIFGWTMVREEGYSYSWLLSTKAWRVDLSITFSLYASVKHSGCRDTQSFRDPKSGVLAIIRDRPKSILGLSTNQTFRKSVIPSRYDIFRVHSCHELWIMLYPCFLYTLSVRSFT